MENEEVINRYPLSSRAAQKGIDLKEIDLWLLSEQYKDAEIFILLGSWSFEFQTVPWWVENTNKSALSMWNKTHIDSQIENVIYVWKFKDDKD